MPTDQGNATVGLTQVPPGAVPGPFNATEERILDATLRLLGRRGVRRLAMSEISEAAGISRGTLYRYFPSKEHVLIGVAAYDEQRFTDGMAKALAPVPDALARVEAFVAFSFDYIREHPARAVFEIEPEFVLGFLLQRLPQLRGALIEQLGDALDSVPAVASGELTRDQLADIVVRLFASSFIIPESDERDLVRSITIMLLPARAEPITGRTHGYRR
jgi:AcrR family transcriptional regulator